MTGTTIFWQLDIISDHTMSTTSIVTMYTWTGSLLLCAGLSTAASRFRPDFDTWWTMSPQYESPIPLYEDNVFGSSGDITSSSGDLFI